MTAAIQTLVEANEMEIIHVDNLAAENNNLTRTITTITTEMATIKNLMGTIQSQINQLALNGPQGSVHTVTHNCAPGNQTPDKNESYCWTYGWTRNNERTSFNCRNKKLAIYVRQPYKTTVVAVKNGLQQEPMYDDVGM